MQACEVIDTAHAATAATCAGFDEQRRAKAFRLAHETLVALIIAVIPRYAGKPGRCRKTFSFNLGPHTRNIENGPSHEYEPGIYAQPCEIRVFRQEPIPRVHGVSPGFLCCRDKLRHVEIACAGLRAADVDGFVGECHMRRASVRIRRDSNGVQTEAPTGSRCTHDDFTPVGNQNSFKHKNYIRMGTTYDRLASSAPDLESM